MWRRGFTGPGHGRTGWMRRVDGSVRRVAGGSPRRCGSRRRRGLRRSGPSGSGVRACCVAFGLPLRPLPASAPCPASALCPAAAPCRYPAEAPSRRRGVHGRALRGRSPRACCPAGVSWLPGAPAPHRVPARRLPAGSRPAWVGGQPPVPARLPCAGGDERSLGGWTAPSGPRPARCPHPRVLGPVPAPPSPRAPRPPPSSRPARWATTATGIAAVARQRPPGPYPRARRPRRQCRARRWRGPPPQPRSGASAIHARSV